MSLSSLSVRRGVTFGVVFLVLTGFGLFSLSRLQLDLYPELTFPKVLVLTSYTGASPEDVETLLTRPIEGAVSAVKGVKAARSDSTQGSSVVTVEFDWAKDMEQAETDVRRKLELIKGALPDDADDPIVVALDPSMQPVVTLMVTGPYPLDRLRKIAEDDVAAKLERIDGIASSNVAGGLKREIHVALDPAKVEAYGLDVSAVLGAIHQENLHEPGGAVEQGSMSFSIQTRGKYRSVREIGEVVVGQKRGLAGLEPLRLSEVARVEDSFHEAQRVIEVDGVSAVWVNVRKQSGANTVKAATAVVKALPEVARESGHKLDFKVLNNQAEFINASLGNLSTTAVAGIAISFLVLLVFLRSVRSSIVVASAIPLSVVATFFVMDQVGMTLNIISMAGLALAIGMLVDNAIVVLENIFRLAEEGLPIREAAVQGAAEVGTAVIASTLTTISVFVPILFVTGIAGVMFKDMAITICFALIVSLAVALSFVPLAASRLLGRRPSREKPRTNSVGSRMTGAYGRALDWTLAHRWSVGVGLLALLAATGILVKTMPTEFMASHDQSSIYVSVETPVSNNLQATTEAVNEVRQQIERLIPAHDRKLVAVDIGTSEGFASIFSSGPHTGTIRVPLTAVGQRTTSQAEYEARIRERLRQVPGIKATVGMPFNMAGGAGDLEIQIRGHDLTAARRLGLELKQRLAAMPQMAEVTYSMEDQKPQLRIQFDRKKMADMGLSTASVSRAVSTFFKGKVAARFSEGGDEYDVLVRYDRQHRLDVGAVRRMPVATAQGITIPLSSIADLSLEPGPTTISRKDQERVTTLTCTLKPHYLDGTGRQVRKDLGGTIAQVERMLAGHSWPDGFSYHVGGTAEDFQESFAALAVALLVSVLLVYLVMASLFESLRQPFIILFTLPLAGIGVVLIFVLSGSAMDVSSLVGVIMLVGIVVNNGIIMVDAGNQLRQQGLGPLEAIARAARQRLRPVLLTSLTTILSMVPLALEIGEGASSWSGMARAVIGGLTLATALTLFVVPTMYTLFVSNRAPSIEPLPTRPEVAEVTT